MNYAVVNLFIESADALHSPVLSFCLSYECIYQYTVSNKLFSFQHPFKMTRITVRSPNIFDLFILVPNLNTMLNTQIMFQDLINVLFDVVSCFHVPEFFSTRQSFSSSPFLLRHCKQSFIRMTKVNAEHHSFVDLQHHSCSPHSQLQNQNRSLDNTCFI